ncbi:MAG: hypothetical protein K0V04_12500, partial [Deltaproteobacteria bacterium]|nr:hypothetical protein [Deltaproteobacteria bacterium]
MLALSCAVVATACRKDDTDAAKAAELAQAGGLPDEGPLPSLRTGIEEAKTLPAVELELLTVVSDGARYYEMALDPSTGRDFSLRTHIEHPAHAVASVDDDRGQRRLLLRVPASVPAATEIRGTLFRTSQNYKSRERTIQPFTAKGPAKSTTDPELARRWAQALGRTLEGNERPWWTGRPGHPWHQFAAGRVQTMATPHGSATGVRLPDTARPRRTELSKLMHTTTAATSMQEALQHDRGLRL